MDLQWLALSFLEIERVHLKSEGLDPSFNRPFSTILTWTCPSRLVSKNERINYLVLFYKTAWASSEPKYLSTAKMSVELSPGDVPYKKPLETWPLIEKSFPKSYQSLINKVKKQFQF